MTRRHWAIGLLALWGLSLGWLVKREFFRSTSAQQKRTELLVIVTPRLIDASDKAPALPTGEPGTWNWDRSLRDSPKPQSQ